MTDRSHHDPKTLELSTSRLQALRPRAKMRAIIGEDSISAFAQTGACAFDHGESIETLRFISYSDLAATREAFQRDLFHRSPAQSVRKPGVMNDTAVADVYAVVAVQRTWGDKMGGEWRLLIKA